MRALGKSLRSAGRMRRCKSGWRLWSISSRRSQKSWSKGERVPGDEVGEPCKGAAHALAEEVEGDDLAVDADHGRALAGDELDRDLAAEDGGEGAGHAVEGGLVGVRLAAEVGLGGGALRSLGL